jgi:hypothetical protein
MMNVPGKIDASAMLDNLSPEERAEVQQQIKEHNDVLENIHMLAQEPTLNINILLQACLLRAVKLYEFFAALPKEDPKRNLLRDADLLITQIRQASLWDNEISRLHEQPMPQDPAQKIVTVPSLKAIGLE